MKSMTVNDLRQANRMVRDYLAMTPTQREAVVELLLADRKQHAQAAARQAQQEEMK